MHCNETYLRIAGKLILHFYDAYIIPKVTHTYRATRYWISRRKSLDKVAWKPQIAPPAVSTNKYLNVGRSTTWNLQRLPNQYLDD